MTTPGSAGESNKNYIMPTEQSPISESAKTGTPTKPQNQGSILPLCGGSAPILTAYIMLCNSIKEYNEESKNRLLQAPETVQFIKDNPDYKFKSLLSFANDVGGEEFTNRMLRGQSIVRDIYKSNMEVILNKGQQIYPLIDKTEDGEAE